MALIESLKAFYKDNVENVDKLNDADSILEVLRAKYGNYKGSNIEEYFKELVNNGISPGGGGGGATIPTITLSGDPETGLTYTCDIGYDEWRSAISNSPYSGTYGTELPCYAENMGLAISKNLDDCIQAKNGDVTFLFYSDGTVQVGGK